MLIVGLTGGIGSGKSAVANLFAKHGVPIIDADVIAREVTESNESALKKIISRFGDQILLQNGRLDRSTLRNIIFESEQERAWLENLLHPIIRQRIEQQISLISAPYCIVCIPLLFETEPYPFLDRILVIDTSEQAQIERVANRDQMDKTRIASILKTQASREQRLKGADDIILNEGPISNLDPQVKKLHAFYKQLGLQ
jgi:dephospho-CoA kinase